MEDPTQIVEQPAATMEEEAQQQVMQEEAVAIDANQDIQYNMAAQEAAQQQYEGYQGQPTAEQYAMAAEQQMQEQQELLQNQQYVQEQERLQAEAMMSKQMNAERSWFWAFPQIEGVPPCARGGHSATLIGASILYFGGHYYAGQKQGYVYLNDTHVLDLNSSRWIKPKVQGTPPAPRYGHTALLAGSRIIIFGGKGGKNVAFKDLHALDPVTMTWYQGPGGAGGPPGRYNHSANIVGGTKMYVFGGWDGKNYFNDVYVLDLEIMAWQRPECTGPAPQPRQGHASILIGNNLVVHGGFKLKEADLKVCGLNQGTPLSTSYMDDIRVLDTETFVWSRLRISGLPPEARYGHTLNISGSDIIMFGGWTKNSGNRDKHILKKEQCEYFQIWSTEEMQWKNGKYIGNPPTQRYGHTATAIGPHLLIFGGWEFSKAINEIIVLREFNQRPADEAG